MEKVECQECGSTQFYAVQVFKVIEFYKDGDGIIHKEDLGEFENSIEYQCVSCGNVLNESEII